MVGLLCRGWPLLFMRSFVCSRRCWASCSLCTSSARLEPPPRDGSVEKPGMLSGTRSDMDIHCLMLGSVGPKPTVLHLTINNLKELKSKATRKSDKSFNKPLNGSDVHIYLNSMYTFILSPVVRQKP